MKCRTDRIPRSAALGDLLRGHLVQSVHALCTYTRFNTVCLLRRPPPGGNSLHAIFFFFFFFKKYELIYEFGSEKYAKMGNLDLENLIKTEMDNFD